MKADATNTEKVGATIAGTAPDSAAALDWLARHRDAGETLASGYQARVRRVVTPFGALVVKEPRAHRWLGHVIRRTIARELEVYRRLEGIPGIARCYGMLDDALVLEHVPGQSYREAQHALLDRARFFDRLAVTLERVHAAGVAHADLKRKDNLVVGPDEQPFVIDFGVASVRGRGLPPFNRVWFDWARQSDWNAWLKLKYGRGLKGLSPTDAARHRPLAIDRVARVLQRLRRRT